MRQQYQLDDIESAKFIRLRPLPGEAFSFWRQVAEVRDLDYKTIISAGQQSSFTALRAGHGKHWCFPAPLSCKKKPVYNENPRGRL